MAEIGDDVEVGQELPAAEQVVQVVDVVGPLRNQEDRVRAVGHEDGGREQKSGPGMRAKGVRFSFYRLRFDSCFVDKNLSKEGQRSRRQT